MANVVITGSTKGIGRGLAAEFVERGHNVTICGRGAADVRRVTADLLTVGPGKACGTTCDVTSKSQLYDLWNFARDQLGQLDIWINNAGRAIGRYPVHELPEDDVHVLVNSNLKGTIFGSQVAIAGFREQGSGALYNMLGGSFDGKRLTPNMGVYSATKAGIWILTKYLLAENKNQNIMIGMISPGMLITENWFDEQRELAEDEWHKVRPLLNILCDHVETSTPWLVEQILQNERYGRRITWLTTGKILRRFFAARVLGQKRDLFSRYDL